MATSAVQLAGAQPRLDPVPAVLREAAVVRGDDVVAQPLAELVRDPLGQAAGVDEHERRAVLSHVRGDAVEHVGHLLGGRDRLELALGQLDREVEVALVAGVDDLRQRPVADEQPARPSRSGAAWPTGRRGSGACSHSASSRSSVSARCEPRLSRATAWISSTITVSTVRSALASARARDQEVERLGGGDDEARRLAHHPRALARSACRRCGPRPGCRARRGRARRRSRRSPRSGRSRFSAMSTASAFSGDT